MAPEPMVREETAFESATAVDGAVECVWDVGAELGEGPIWSARDGAVWFVDIKGHKVHRWIEATGERRSWPAPEQVSFIVPVEGDGFVCGLKSGLHLFDPQSGRFSLIIEVEPELPGNRLNDGYVDSRGRLWFGTMDDSEAAPSGSLYRFDSGGLHRCDSGYVITNGPAVSPDGRTLYHTDTRGRIVYAFDLDRRGEVSHKRVFARIEPGGGNPDGPAVDSEGDVWDAMFGGWGLCRHRASGEAAEMVRMPCANITKAAFGGSDLRTLYVTSAWKFLTEEQRAEQRLAGGLFRVRVDRPGLPQNLLRRCW